MKDAPTDSRQQAPAHEHSEFAAVVAGIASRGVDVIVLDEACRPLAATRGAVFEFRRQDALRLEDGRVAVVDPRQQAAFAQYVGLSARYSVESRPSLICFAVERKGAPGTTLRIELRPGPRRSADQAGTCVAVLRR